MSNFTRGHTFADSGSAAAVNAAALHALIESATIVDGTVSTAKLADGAVSEAKLADDAVATNKLADDAVTSDKIADDAVGADQVADGIIGLNHLAPNARPTSTTFEFATAFHPGAQGLVPAPGVGNQDMVLHGDGWRTVDYDTPALSAARQTPAATLFLALTHF